MNADLVAANELAKAVCEAVGLNSTQVARIIVDMRAEEFVRIFVEMYGSSKLLELDWGRGLSKAEIRWRDK